MDSNLANIEEYFNEISQDYPGLTLAQCSDICRYPFKFVKFVMASGELKNIRLQYLGVFTVSKSRVNYNKKTLEENYNKGLISKDKYEKKLKILNNYEDK